MNNLIGGTLTGEGSFGCVYYPNLRCNDGTFSKRVDGYISKIMPKKDAQEEIEKELKD